MGGNPTHYGDPATGCKTDEIDVQVQGVKGDFCTPSCSLFKACPSDVPSRVTAKPQCALQNSSTNKKYCALICDPSTTAAATQCGSGACQAVQGSIGICTYPH